MRPSPRAAAAGPGRDPAGGQALSGKDKRVIILCAFGRRQIIPVKKLVQAVDPNAFVIVCDAHEMLGEGFGTYDPTGL